MKFKFKTQQYQVDAVNAVIDVFKGQPNVRSEEYTRDLGTASSEFGRQGTIFENDPDYDDYSDIGYANAKVKVSESALLNNLNEIQRSFNLPLAPMIDNTLGAISLGIEMETGTGKTYVYTRTMFELHKIYGWNKFIVIVPSVAIREGVRKSFEQTEQHFMEIYGSKLRYFIYSAGCLNKIDDFSKSDAINVMIINIQAFNRSFDQGKNNKESLIIYSNRDDFQGRTPIDVIKRNRPILILDEPQKMGGDATQKALHNFNPLFILNYSATLRQRHNIIYVLDALDAYDQKLVKKIEVKGFEVKNLTGTHGYLYLQHIRLSEKAPEALIELEISSKGQIRKKTRWFSVGDDLYHASGELEQYRHGFTLADIQADRNMISFTNGVELGVGCSLGDVSEKDIRRVQIRETIISHLAKEREMYAKGIKVLSLFFIDKVSNYRVYDDDGQPQLGEYGRIFEEEYVKVLNEQGTILDTPYDRYLNSIPVSKTHDGYFSIDKKGRFIDSQLKRGSDESDDVSAYDLIFKDKERLLSFDEPRRFIFSHSALREGWDNPNVFQICTLKHSTSDVQRHQEVGRGLRICVDQDGNRMDAAAEGRRFHDVNKLTVIANESYSSFVSGLQSQITAGLFNRTKQITDSTYFVNKTVRYDDDPNSTLTLDKEQAQGIYFYLVQNKYVDTKGHVTDLYKTARAQATLAALPEELGSVSEDIHHLIQSVYDASVGPIITNAHQTEIINNPLNDNFQKREFQELWKRINKRYAYKVSFDSDELISNAIAAINSDLRVTRALYTIVVGEQDDETSREKLAAGEAFRQTIRRDVDPHAFGSGGTAYDLLGKVAQATQLTRRTIARILCGIDPVRFADYKFNPEDFIRKVSLLINEQKASVIIEHITYNRTDEEPYDSNIFACSRNRLEFTEAYKAQKNVQNYVVTDSSVERKFAQDLDAAQEVIVYAKLPNGFAIPTPMGPYTPDWAIVFQKDDVRHIYFVAETKGSLDSLQLRGIENGKIKCAETLFASLSDQDVFYHKVSKYDDLLALFRL